VATWYPVYTDCYKRASQHVVRVSHAALEDSRLNSSCGTIYQHCIMGLQNIIWQLY